MSNQNNEDKLNKIQRDVEWIIRYLLNRDQPVNPPPYIPCPPSYPTVPSYNPITICPKCGMKWEGVMMYSCSNQPCPIQPNVSYSSATLRNHTTIADKPMSNPGDKDYDT